MYIKPFLRVDPIVNDTLDKNSKSCAFTQGHRYTTLALIQKANKTSELVASPDEDVNVSPEENVHTEK
jgi:ribosome biogenesis protein Tsr3